MRSLGWKAMPWSHQIAFGAALLMAAVGTEAAPQETPVRIGVLVKRGPERCLEKWGPTVDYLSRSISNTSFVMVPLSFGEIYSAAECGDVEFVLANPSIYVELELGCAARRIVTLKNLGPAGASTVFGGVVFCKAGRDDIQCLADLKGKRVMAVDENSLGGWHTAWREMKAKGIEPERDFRELSFGGTHDAVVYAVRDGKVDAGTIRTDVLDRMALEGKVDPQGFHVIHDHVGSTDGHFPGRHSTRMYPEWPMAKLDHTPDELAESVATALLQMPLDCAAARAARCAGWTVPLNYQPVHDCLKELRVGPYKDFGRVTAAEAIRQHWPTVLVFSVFLVSLGLGTICVARLNRRLREANRDLERAGQEARGLTRKAEAANRAKSDFLAGMSHEIRTPLNGIIGMTDMLAESGLTATQREFCGIASTCGHSLLALVNNILDFSKMDAGGLEMELIDFDLRIAADEVADSLSARASEKQLEFSCFVASAVPLLLRGDPGRLRQTLINLGNNAIKFTGTGEVAIEVTLQEETPTHATILFAVRDTGIGIPPNRLERLFKAFSQVDASTTRKYRGTGLGLVISKQLAEAMGGRIGVDSLEGRGSTFWFTAVLEKQPVQRQVTVPALGDIHGARVLIVDDNRTSRRVLKEYLKATQCRVTETCGGSEALQELHAAQEGGDPYRIAILDMCMPEMDGESLGQLIKSDPSLREVILVLLTSVEQRGDVERVSKIGFSAYLTKPVKQSQLFDCLRLVASEPVDTGQTGDASIVTRYSLASHHKSRVRILLVEDNPVNQKVALLTLEKIGYRADAVANGREALEALGRVGYDLVLMDVEMPVMGGLEATRVIRNPDSGVLNHDVPIVAMTAPVLEECRERCLESGMNDCICKPVQLQHLADTIDRQLRGTGSSAPEAAA